MFSDICCLFIFKCERAESMALLVEQEVASTGPELSTPVPCQKEKDGGMSQVVKQLLGKLKALSSNRITEKRK